MVWLFGEKYFVRFSRPPHNLQFGQLTSLGSLRKQDDDSYENATKPLV